MKRRSTATKKKPEVIEVTALDETDPDDLIGGATADDSVEYMETCSPPKRPTKKKTTANKTKSAAKKPTTTTTAARSNKKQQASSESHLVHNESSELYPAYEKEGAYLTQLFDALIEKNKSNSIIISGEAGVGKSTLVDACLARYPQLNPDISTNAHSGRSALKSVVFKFDGYLHGKNEPALLRQIGKRLNQFLEKNEQIAIDDLDDFDANQLEEAEIDLKITNSIPKIMGQFRFLVDHVPTFRTVIILDQFEMFCSKQQRLLYNLFDLIQSGKSVLIIGITRVLDCFELLISRVQSRLNQRSIHIASPLKTLEEYKKFCDHQIRVYSHRLPHLFDNMRQDVFEKELARNFSINRTFADAKRFLLQSSFVPRSTTIPGDENTEHRPMNIVALNKDPKVIDLINLNKNELIILLVANKHLRNLDQEKFNCRDLHEWTTQVMNMKNLRFEQLVKAIHKMMELDLIIHAKLLRTKSQLSITPWTKLMLNISDFQLKELIDNLGNKLPTYIKQLLN